MSLFRKKPIGEPVDIDAAYYRSGMEDDFVLTGMPDQRETARSWVGDAADDDTATIALPVIRTPEGPLFIAQGDWIITDVKGERYPCKPDIFEATYEAVRKRPSRTKAFVTLGLFCTVGLTWAAERYHLTFITPEMAGAVVAAVFCLFGISEGGFTGHGGDN